MSEEVRRRRPAEGGERRRHAEEGERRRRPADGSRERRRYEEAEGRRSERSERPRRPQGERPRPERDGERRSASSVRNAERRRNTGRNGKRKKNKSKTKLILFAVEILVLLLMLGALYFILTGTKNTQKVHIAEDKIVMNESVKKTMEAAEAGDEEAKRVLGYRNIALFGVDSRDGSLGKGTRSDTIIVASINQETGDVKLMSIFRDTYLNLGNDDYNKCNAAYAKGGPEQAINMINMNLDMNITDYVTVGFKGLIEVIDALGGVEIDVTKAEISHLNNYQISMVGKSKDGKTFTAQAGKDYTPVTNPGLQTLNGLQATAYCRIRYVGNDFARAQRQRDVITAIANKSKKADPKTLTEIANSVMKNVSTSLDIDEIIGVLSDLSKYNVVGSEGFPFEEYRSTGTVKKGSCVIPKDLTKNVVKAHEFLFDQKDYEPSAEILKYNDKIAADTSKATSAKPEDFSAEPAATEEPTDGAPVEGAPTEETPAESQPAESTAVDVTAEVTE